MQIPAVCSHCGLVFATGISVRNGGGADISNGWSKCPRCTSDSPIVEGYIQIHEGLLRLIEGPEFSQQILDLMNRAVLDVRRGTKTPAVALSEVKKKNPAAAASLRQWIGIGINFASMMISAAALALAYMNHQGNEPLSEKSTEAADRYIHDGLQPDVRNSHLSKTPPNRPGASKPTKPVAEPEPNVQPTKKNRKERRAQKAKKRTAQARHFRGR